MAVAARAAAIGERGEGGSFLFPFAQLLETVTADRARSAIRALMGLSLTEAAVRRDRSEESVPAAEVRNGERLVMRTGQKFPPDGEVVAGRSAVNQAPATGESFPVEKEPGAGTFVGLINSNDLLEVCAGHDARTDVRAVGEAQASRTPSQPCIDRFSQYDTPAGMLGGAGDPTEARQACTCHSAVALPAQASVGELGSGRRDIGGHSRRARPDADGRRPAHPAPARWRRRRRRRWAHHRREDSPSGGIAFRPPPRPTPRGIKAPAAPPAFRSASARWLRSPLIRGRTGRSPPGGRPARRTARTAP